MESRRNGPQLSSRHDESQRREASVDRFASLLRLFPQVVQKQTLGEVGN